MTLGQWLLGIKSKITTIIEDVSTISNEVSALSDDIEGLEDRTETLASRDYIVEQGTSGIWTYRKWSSGIAECWGTMTISNDNVSTQWGGMYYGSEHHFTYPTGLFITTPNTQISVSHAHNWVTLFYGENESNVRSTSFYFGRPTSATVTAYVECQSVGMWK